MTLLRRSIEHLDRPGGREFLSVLSTWYARRLTGEDVRILHDGLWIHRSGDGEYFVDGPNFRYYSDTILGWRSKLRATVEAIEDFWFHLYRPRAGDTIVDIGAGRGEDSFVFSRAVGKTGRVLAVEAHPSTYAYLLKTCRWNQLENVTPLQYAIVSERGTARIEDGDRYQSNSVLSPGAKTPTVEVPAVSLDELLDEQSVERVDFLKMNIEGAERLTLPGLRKTLSKTACLCVACHDHRADRGEGAFFRTHALVEEFLRDHRFEVSLRADHPRPYVRHHVHGVKRS